MGGTRKKGRRNRREEEKEEDYHKNHCKGAGEGPHSKPIESHSDAFNHYLFLYMILTGSRSCINKYRQRVPKGACSVQAASCLNGWEGGTAAAQECFVRSEKSLGNRQD